MFPKYICFLTIWTTSCAFLFFLHTFNVSFLCCLEVKQVLPEVVEMLPNDDTGSNLPTEVTASLCHILNNLSQSDRQHVRAIVNEGALPKIINISHTDKRLACLTFSSCSRQHSPRNKEPLVSDVQFLDQYYMYSLSSI